MPRRRQFGTVRKLPSGRFQAFYFHEGSTHKAPQTYSMKSDATAWLSVQAGEVAKGTWQPATSTKLTVAELAERWLVSNPLKRDSSRSRDSSILTQHVLPAIGTLQLSKVTKARCQELVDGWSATLKPSTVVRQAATLRALFSFALDSELIVRSPAARLRLPQMDLVARPELSAGDLDRLAKALGPNEATMMWVGAVTGLRWAECAGLTIGDLDLTSDTIRVERQLDRDGKLATLKTKAARRELAIPDWLADDLRDHLGRCGLALALPSALVFTTAEGKPLHYSNWRRRVWGPACEAAGLPGLGFHDLRSNNATALVDEGINPKVLQQRLGHASVSTTLGIYARATKEADRSAADLLGARLRPLAEVVRINPVSYSKPPVSGT